MLMLGKWMIKPNNTVLKYTQQRMIKLKHVNMILKEKLLKVLLVIYLILMNLAYFLVGNHAVYRMSAINGEDKNEWIKKIRDCISENPLMNTTNNKRKVLTK